MKKVKAILLVAVIAGSYLSSIQDVDAQIGNTKTYGSTYTQQENEGCTSGVAHKCEGSGSLCQLTIGWDCQPPRR
ncbi:hypothetical protein ACFO3O_11495 [Dokdonia ponticola]|uniref:Uncharacterized protein n=1 Tax=Dokdonia ponticola TaxID=2041041 RepID=A0ABV9HYE6_9FLAO